MVIANKADKIATTKVDATIKELQNSLNPLKDLSFLPFSSEKKIYIDDVWEEIYKTIK
jgi:GTP-binding protein EngB required for normal cell division